MREVGPFVLRDMHGVAQAAWRAYLIGDELLSVRRGGLLEVLVDPVEFDLSAPDVRVALSDDVRASLQVLGTDPQRVVRWLAELRPLLAVPEVVLAPAGGACRLRQRHAAPGRHRGDCH